MSPYYVKLDVSGADFNDIYELLSKSIGNVFRSYIVNEPNRVAIIIGTKWFFKTNSDASITILIHEEEDKLRIQLISYGGREGIFGLSLGVHEDLARRVLKVLKENKVKYKISAKMNYSDPSRIERLRELDDEESSN